jgi:hypothetical protein
VQKRESPENLIQELKTSCRNGDGDPGEKDEEELEASLKRY